MQKSITLCLWLLFTLSLAAQDKQKAANGWEYIVNQEGKGKKATRESGVEALMLLKDSNGELLFSSYELGLPDYQTLADVPEAYQVAVGMMSEGSKFTFYVPMDDFKKGLGQGMQAQLPGDHVVWELEILKVLPGKPSIADVVQKIMEQDGPDAAFAQYNKLINNKSGDIYINEWEVNSLGYSFLQAAKTQEAISIFKYNVKMNPNSANVYDSLGEALAASGQKQAAIEHYKKSLELNPNNENAKKMIAELEKQ